jgi:hypothetical protein
MDFPGCSPELELSTVPWHGHVLIGTLACQKGNHCLFHVVEHSISIVVSRLAHLSASSGSKDLIGLSASTFPDDI